MTAPRGIVAVVLGLLVGGACAHEATPEAASPEAATAEQKQQATQHFERGLAAFDQARYEEALSAFRDSFAVVASPNARLMIARSLVGLGRRAEAYDELQITAADAASASFQDPKYDQTAKAARAELQELEKGLALLEVRVSGAGPEDELFVGGRSIPRASWDKPIAVDPGLVRVELVRPSGEAVLREIPMRIGSQTAVDVRGSLPEK